MLASNRTENTSVNMHITDCVMWVLSGRNHKKQLSTQPFIFLDSTWKKPTEYMVAGSRKVQVMEDDSIICSGCSCLLRASECVRAVVNPLSCAPYMIVCQKCGSSLHESLNNTTNQHNCYQSVHYPG